METKYCHKCQQYKPITEFYKNNRGGCRKCIRAYQKRYYEEHYAPEKKSDPEGFRTCSKCRELKPVSEYYRDKSNISGYNHHCKKCSDTSRESRRQIEKEAKAALREVIPDGFKKCAGCKTILPLTEFRQLKSGARAGKPQPRCKKCEQRYRQENREKITEQRKAYSQRPEVRARKNVTRNTWRKSNPERVAKEKASQREYRKREYVKARKREHGANYRSRSESQEKARQRTIEWRKANPEKQRHHSRIKAYRKKNAEGSHTLEQWQTLLTFFDYCPRCGKKKILTRDHIIPLNKGGSNWIWNIQPLCRSCNAAKQDHSTEDYRPEPARQWAASEMLKAGFPVPSESVTGPRIQQLPFNFLT